MAPLLTTDMDGQSYFEFQQYFRQRQGWKLASFTFFTLLLLVVVEVFAVRSMVPPVAEAILLGIAAFVLVALAALVLLHQALPAMRRWQWISTALAAIYGLGWAGLFALPLHGTHLASVALYSDLFIIIAVIAFFSYRSATYLAVLPVLLAWLVSDTVLSDTALSNTLLPSTGLSDTHAFGMPEALIFFTVLVRVVMVIMVREYLYYWFHSSVWHGYQEQRLRLELANVALIDPLTGLQNHKHFDIVMEREVLSARRDNTQLAVVALSIAPLRWYGMTYGQDAAKALVKRIGRGLRRGTFRPRDFLARLNGDEFVVVLPDTDIEGAKVVVARLQQLVHQSCDTVIHQRLKQPVVVKGLVMEWQPDVSVHQFKRALSTQLTQLPAQDADTVIWQPE